VVNAIKKVVNRRKDELERVIIRVEKERERK
jgi:hypothetical protein